MKQTVTSKYEPKSKNVTWIDMSSGSPVQKNFINGKWRPTGGGGGGAGGGLPTPTVEDQGKIMQIAENKIQDGTKEEVYVIVPEQLVQGSGRPPANFALQDVNSELIQDGLSVNIILNEEQYISNVIIENDYFKIPINDEYWIKQTDSDTFKLYTSKNNMNDTVSVTCIIQEPKYKNVYEWQFKNSIVLPDLIDSIQDDYYCFYNDIKVGNIYFAYMNLASNSNIDYLVPFYITDFEYEDGLISGFCLPLGNLLTTNTINYSDSSKSFINITVSGNKNLPTYKVCVVYGVK